MQNNLKLSEALVPRSGGLIMQSTLYTKGRVRGKRRGPAEQGNSHPLAPLALDQTSGTRLTVGLSGDK